MKTLSKILFCGSLLAAPSVALANGFVVNDHAANATGRGDAVVATVSDGGGMVHNPAGIAAVEGTHVFVGASLLAPKATFNPADGGASVSTDSGLSITPQVYGVYRINKMISAGAGLHTPFGSKIVWPAGSTVADEALSQSLRTFFITPMVGINLQDKVPGLRFGLGLDLVPATVKLEQEVRFGNVTGNATLGGNAFGVGFRAGVQYQPQALPQLSLGATYKHNVKLDFEGDGDFDIADPYRMQLPPDGKITTSIDLPRSVLFGAAYRPIPKLELEVNGAWMQWSSVERIEIALADGSSTISKRDYKDTLSIRAGAEYQVNCKVALRAGYMWDPTPVPRTTLGAALPDINRHDVTAGGSIKISPQYAVHAGVLVVLPGSNETAPDMYEPVRKGTYDVSAVVGSLSLTGNFGKPAGQ